MVRTPLRRSGSVSRALVPFVSQAHDEAGGLVQALGGEDQVSEQRMLLIRDTVRLGTLLSALLARALQREEIDPDEATKCATLANARRSNLVALGLERVARDMRLDLKSYLAARENSQERASATIDTAADAEGAPVLDVAPAAFFFLAIQNSLPEMKYATLAVSASAAKS